MQLTDEQRKTVARWVKEGCGLSAIQKRLADEFKVTLTYLDVRFLVLDLGLDLKETKADTAAAKPIPPPPPAAEEDAGDEVLEPETLPGGVKVELDRLMRPGTLVSGTVIFSDGVKATWALDQRGRLALGAERKDYRPSADDIQAFQQAVSRELQRAGYG